MQASQEVGTVALSGLLQTRAKNNKKLAGSFSSVFSKKIFEFRSRKAPNAQNQGLQKQDPDTNIHQSKETDKPFITRHKLELQETDTRESSHMQSKKIKTSKHDQIAENAEKIAHSIAIVNSYNQHQNNLKTKISGTSEENENSIKKMQSTDSQKSAQWSIIDERKQKANAPKAQTQNEQNMKQDQGQTMQKREPEIILSIKQEHDVQQDVQPHSQSIATSQHSLFSDILARHLENASQDIVKTAQIVLQDNDSGVIRMRLEPETLGGVKIELKLADKKISGTIVVESDIVQAAFKDSYAALRDAFNSQGFELTQLNVDVRNGNSSSYNEKQPFFAEGLKKIEQAVPETASGSALTLSSGATINLVV